MAGNFPPEAGASSPRHHGRRLAVVVVDDAQADVEIVIDELRRAGFDVRHRAVCTEPALLDALHDLPDLVISDYRMPRLDGLRALELTQSVDREIPFILVSGTVNEDLAVEVLHRGAVDYIPKDRLARLGPATRRALELREARIARRRAENAIREREARLSAILDNEPECVKVLSEDGTLLEMNRAGLAMLDAASLQEVVDRGITSFVLPEHRAAFGEALSAVQRGESRAAEFEICGLKGTRRWMEMHAAPLVTPHGGRQVLAVTRDVTAHRLADARLMRLNRMHAMLSGINALIVRAQRRDDLLRDICRLAVVQGEFSRAWVGLLDRGTMRLRLITAGNGDRRPREEWVALGMGDGILERCVRDGRITHSNDLASGDLPAGDAARFGSAAVLPLLASGEVAGVMVLQAGPRGFFDDNELRLLSDLAGDVSFALAHIEMRERTQALALQDALTGLPNHTLLVARVEQALKACARSGRVAAVVYLSVERLRHISESLGRQVSDELVRRVAERLQLTARREDTLARPGERRFAMVVDGVADPAIVSSILTERIFPAFDRPVRAAGQDFHLQLKAGIALGDSVASAEDLCANAERALRSARSGGNAFRYHEPEMNARMAASLALESKLRLALERGEFALHYQPIRSARAGRMTALEALLRWNDPERGLVGAGEFVALLEETGLIVDVGRWVMRRAAADAMHWRRQGLRPPPIAINVSALQLRQDEFVDELVEVVRDSGAADPILSIEITESVLMDNVDRAASKIARLREAGVGAAIDDFGTGYSSLAYVSLLPVQSLKIDRSFVGMLGSGGSARTIVSTVIALGHSLGLGVIAEGVENAGDERLLTELGCDELQGYAIARPAAAEAVAAHIPEMR